MKPVLRLTEISKSFGEVRVLDRVNLEAFPGEVHILAGENGAGKSTLMKILAGVHTRYEGQLELEGGIVHFGSPHEAAEAGISIIHQEMSLIPGMSVLDNLFLGRKLPVWRGQGLEQALEREARALCEKFGLTIDLRQPVEKLPLAARNQIEILKALTFRSKVLVMDEPTSALGVAEVERMFTLIARLKEEGCAILYISHRMDEIYRIGDRITVLRDGKSIGTAPAVELPQPKLIEWMIGRSLGEQFPSRKDKPGTKPMLVVRNFRGTTFEARAGEILGIAGLQGSGKSELMQALYSPSASDRGQVEIDGRPFRLSSPRSSIRQGLALLTSDRKETGLCLGLSILENITLTHVERFARAGFIHHGRERKAAQETARRLRVKCQSLDQRVVELSGGNQQKVALGKCTETHPKVLLLDEPTRGVDIGAKHEIYELIFELAAQGSAIVLITSEMPECLALADRILVMHRGKISAELSRAEATQEKILKAAMGEAV